MPETAERLTRALPDQYVVQRELGRGGTAIVFVAEDRKHRRLVAIKVLRPEVARCLGSERFLREIEIASRLHHPNILPLFDSGEAEGVLYYVMPYVEGDSLRDRMTRERQLPLADALRIAVDVAEALAFAHRHGIVHRDIKPENILLQGDRALVADFGIARAISVAAGDRLTESGLVVGTPHYMSPEQADTKGQVDGRSDVYSLGCVLFEMLIGEPPYTGPDVHTILARHIAATLPSLRVPRGTVPIPVEQAVLQALAKLPVDRFRTASEFAEALKSAVLHPDGIISRPRSATRLKAMVGLAVVAVSLLIWLSWAGVGQSILFGADTTRYLVLPPTLEAGLTPPGNVGQLVRDGLAAWTGIHLVDQFEVDRELAADSGRRLDAGKVRELALRLNAGRYVRSDVARAGDSIRVHAVLYGVASGSSDSTLAEAAVRMPADFSTTAVVGNLIERLLFRDAPMLAGGDTGGTASAPARQAFLSGQMAVERWDLGRADSNFAAATTHDARYSEAFLWLALVRSWAGQPVAAWRSPAERAATARSRMSTRDGLISDATLAAARSDRARSCQTWQRAASVAPNDFVVWYGWADCLRLDNAVIRDSRSPSGWRFRSSYHQALKAYQRAFQLLPSVHTAFLSPSFASARHLINPATNDLRGGRALAPDSLTFVSSPSWQGDSLVFFPIPTQELSVERGTGTATTGEAIRHQRELFRDIATAWVAAFPQSSAALEALALSQESLDDPSAIETIRKARTLARDPLDRLRIAGSEVWMELRASLPGDSEGLKHAKTLADSLLLANQSTHPGEPRLLASLAALTGRANRAAQLSRVPEVWTAWGVPPAIAGDVSALLVFASMGGPVDSLRVLESRVVKALDRLPPGQRQQAEMEWLARAATLAFPEHRFASIPHLVGKGDYLLDAQAMFMRGDTSGALRAILLVKPARLAQRPAERQIDALYPEAWLLAQLGHEEEAITWLDPTLNQLSGSPPQLYADAARAGPLVRAMRFRAGLTRGGQGEGASALWHSTVRALWNAADSFLQGPSR